MDIINYGVTLKPIWKYTQYRQKHTVPSYQKTEKCLAGKLSFCHMQKITTKGQLAKVYSYLDITFCPVFGPAIYIVNSKDPGQSVGICAADLSVYGNIIRSSPCIGKTYLIQQTPRNSGTSF